MATITMVGERAPVGSLLGMLMGRIRDCSKIFMFMAVYLGPGLSPGSGVPTAQAWGQ